MRAPKRLTRRKAGTQRHRPTPAGLVGTAAGPPNCSCRYSLPALRGGAEHTRARQLRHMCAGPDESMQIPSVAQRARSCGRRAIDAARGCVATRAAAQLRGEDGQTARRPDGQTARRPDGQTARRPDGQTARRPDGQTARRPDGQTARRPDGQTARRPDGQTARRPDGQTARRPDGDHAHGPYGPAHSARRHSRGRRHGLRLEARGARCGRPPTSRRWPAPVCSPTTRPARKRSCSTTSSPTASTPPTRTSPHRSRSQRRTRSRYSSARRRGCSSAASSASAG